MIENLRIRDFRSIRDQVIGPLGPLFTIVGRNGTGKSNILRSLNLFFNNEVETGVPVDLARDFHRAAERKDKRVIRVEVTFALPIPPFRWRTGSINDAATGLGFAAGRFSLAREWSIDPATREVIDAFQYRASGTEWLPVPQDQRSFVELLTSRLIRYRYVPNHVHPITLIEQERAKLQHTLLTKLNRSRQLREVLDPEAPLAAMANVATELVQPVVEDLAATAPEIASARMATPASWADVVLSLDIELRGHEQHSRSALLHGSGHQSVIALSMLHLIDTDFSSAFGWHQGTIWGLEEPEAYLHHELAYQLSSLLSRYAMEERFQVLVTTHSPTVVARSRSGVLIDSDGAEVLPPRELIERLATAGVGPFVHPLLVGESKPLLLVEGPSDRTHLEVAYEVLARPNPWDIVATQDLALPGGTTGFKQLGASHGTTLAARRLAAPVVGLVDHSVDAGAVAGLADRFASLHPSSTVLRWDATTANPDLDLSEFRGIEAFLATTLLEAADLRGLIKLMRPSAGTPIGCRQINKTGMAALCAERRTRADYVHFSRMLAFLESHLTTDPMLSA